MLRSSWDDVAGTAHQMMARARREREEYSWTSRSIGASNGRHGRHDGACRSRGVGVRYVVIPCARERQHPGRAPRAWGHSLSRVCASIWSSLEGASTGGMTIFLIPECFPSGLEAASCGARQYAGPVAASKRGSPRSAFSHLRESILFHITKEKQLFSWLAEKRVIDGRAREQWQEVKVDMAEERFRTIDIVMDIALQGPIAARRVGVEPTARLNRHVRCLLDRLHGEIFRRLADDRPWRLTHAIIAGRSLS